MFLFGLFSSRVNVSAASLHRLDWGCALCGETTLVEVLAVGQSQSGIHRHLPGHTHRTLAGKAAVENADWVARRHLRVVRCGLCERRDIPRTWLDAAGHATWLPLSLGVFAASMAFTGLTSKHTMPIATQALMAGAVGVVLVVAWLVAIPWSYRVITREADRAVEFVLVDDQAPR